MADYRLTISAQADIVDILEHTQAYFGEAARLRYEMLLTTALRDIRIDQEGTVLIGRVLYDGMELARHLPSDRDWR